MNLDPILYWNDVALEVLRRDFTVNHDGNGTADADQGLSPEQGGPTLTTRALAIVHLAMYGAYAGTAGGVSLYPPLAAFVGMPGQHHGIGRLGGQPPPAVKAAGRTAPPAPRRPWCRRPCPAHLP